MRRVFSDAVISGIVLLLLLAALVVIDPRVREHTGAFISTPGASSAGVSAQFGEVASVVVDAARDQSVGHAPMMIFVSVATVLFLAMFRS